MVFENTLARGKRGLRACRISERARAHTGNFDGRPPNHLSGMEKGGGEEEEGLVGNSNKASLLPAVVVVNPDP